jgi:hyperosmotically inducible periplasmic protein
MRVIRAFVILLLLLVVAVFAWGLFAGRTLQRGERPVETSRAIDVDTARQRGAELGEKAALATQKVQETIDEAGITGKIKAKLALDDYVKARSINVTTNGTVVTLSGQVHSASERQRAVAIATETAGVSRVVDRLEIRS